MKHKKRTYTINIWLKSNGAHIVYEYATAYEKGSFYCISDGTTVYKYPIADIWRIVESYPQDLRGF